MDPKTQYRLLIFFFVSILSFSWLLPNSGSNCHLSSHLNFLSPAGGSCAAEQTVPPSPITHTNTSDSILAPALILFAKTFHLAITILESLLAFSVVLSLRKRLIEPLLTRRGPTNAQIFLPYLFATHGM